MPGSGTETPDDLVVDPAERGGAAWMAMCEKQLADEEGCKRFWFFVRRFKKNGGDMDKLCADLAFGVGDEPDALRRFLNQEEDYSLLSSLLGSVEQEDKIKWMNILNA